MFILANHKKDKSYSEIAGIARRSKSRLKSDKTLELKPRTGRPPMTTKRDDCMIVKMSLKGRFDTATSTSRAFCEQTGKPISRKTVSRRLNKEKLVIRIPCRKLLIFKKIKRFVLTSPQSTSCGQKNNGIWFTLLMNLNSTF